MNVKKYRTLLLCCITALTSTAQEAPMRGRIIAAIRSEKNQPIENATVELRRQKDSSLAKAAVSDKNGAAELEGIRSGDYFLKITSLSYTTYFSKSITLAAGQSLLQVPVITLQGNSNSIQEVVVTGRKPFIQRLADRLVVNVENSIVSAGSTAMDVLERSPGVTVDQNDVIAMRGKQGVIIMIDGKPSPLNGADLANYLRGLPSNAIERIDLITNPSAKYDASGNSGIIDIRMKKDQRLGTNGTLTAGYGQGVYPKVNAGTTLNYRDKKMNLFGNYNYSYREGLNHLYLDRNFYTNGTYSGGDLKDNYAHTRLFSRFAGRCRFFPGQKKYHRFCDHAQFGEFQ